MWKVVLVHNLGPQHRKGTMLAWEGDRTGCNDTIAKANNCMDRAAWLLTGVIAYGVCYFFLSSSQTSTPDHRHLVNL